MQRLWRLDAAEGQDLGSVRSGGQGQLITRNPQTGAPGVEIRTRHLQLEATGRMARAAQLPIPQHGNEEVNLLAKQQGNFLVPRNLDSGRGACLIEKS